MAHTNLLLPVYVVYSLHTVEWQLGTFSSLNSLGTCVQDMRPCTTPAVESSKIHNGYDMACSWFPTRQLSLSHMCSIGFRSGNKLGRGRLAMFCWFLYSSMMRVKWGLAMSSRRTMFWPSSESKGGLTPDSRIWSWYVWEFKVPVTTFNCIMWSSDNAPRTIMLH